MFDISHDIEIAMSATHINRRPHRHLDIFCMAYFNHNCGIIIRWVLTCHFSSQGKLYIRGDSKIFRFQNGKSESLFLQRKNPRRISWTVLYRRQHRKGISEVSNPNFIYPFGLYNSSGWKMRFVGRRGRLWGKSSSWKIHVIVIGGQERN
jgi:ribosomal protein L24E